MQPNGVVVGTVTLRAREGWRVLSRHEVGTRTRFWVRDFSPSMFALGEHVTDEIWDRQQADQWVEVQVTSLLRAGHQITDVDGNPGPFASNNQTGKEQK